MKPLIGWHLLLVSAMEKKITLASIIRMLVLFFMAFTAVHAIANDGFYQGAGTSLIPIKVKDIRVISEQLHIAPLHAPKCYEVYLRGKPASVITASLEAASRKAGEIGTLHPKAGECSPFDSLRTLWQATVTYKVIADKNIDNALLAFPVPTWNYEYTDDDGLNSFQVPATTGFETRVNGIRINDAGVRPVKGLSKAVAIEEDWEESLAFQWHYSFKAGVTYTIHTIYDFGVDYASSQFYDPWHNGRCPWEPSIEKWQTLNAKCPGNNGHALLYYLTPINTWSGAPPQHIAIEVQAPNSAPVEFMTPGALKPTCVDKDRLHFNMHDTFPEDELLISYPDVIPGPYARTGDSSLGFSSMKEWSRFLEIMGPHAKFTCAFTEGISRRASNAAMTKTIRKHPCVDTCGKDD